VLARWFLEFIQWLAPKLGLVCLISAFPLPVFSQSSNVPCFSNATLEIVRRGDWTATLKHVNELLASTHSPNAPNASKSTQICMRSFRAVTLGRLSQLELATKEQLINLELAKSELGAEHPGTMDVEMHLATLYSWQGRYDLSIPVNRQLIPKFERYYGSISLQLAIVIRNLSTSLHWTGNFADALPYDQRVLSIVTKMDRGPKGCMHEIDCQRTIGRAHSHLAYSLSRNGRNSEAFEHAEKGFALQRDSKGQFHEDTLDSQLTLATVLLGLNRRAEARELQSNTMNAARTHLGERHQITLKASGDFAASSESQPERQEANEMDRDRLAQIKERVGSQHPDFLLASSNLAGRLASIGNHRESLLVSKEAVQAMISRTDTLQFDDRTAEKWEQTQSYLVDLYIIALIRNRQFQDAFLTSEYFKLRNLSASIDLDARASFDSSNHEQLKTLRKQMAELDQRVAITRSLGQNTQSLIAQRSTIFNRWSGLLSQGDATLPSAASWPLWTQALFSRGEPVLAYKFMGKNLYAFVVSPQETSVFILDSQDRVRPTINAYRLAMRHLASLRPGQKANPPIWRMKDGGYKFGVQQPAPDAIAIDSMDEVIQSLSNWLIKPVEPAIASAKNLLISVDHNLGQAPFDELKVSSGILGDKHTISLLPSLSLVNTLIQRKVAYQKIDRQPLLALGGAHYAKQIEISPLIRINRESDSTLRPMDAKVLWQSVKRDRSLLALANLNFANSMRDLPGSLLEVQEIAKMHISKESSLIFTGESASEETINRLAADGSLEKFKTLHFAAHGFLSDDEPGLSAIVLSQIRRAPGTDGYITAAELSAYKLQSDLVIVSACDSGASEFTRGSGSIGLAYSLMQAGTISALLSLWPVPDLDTQRFMVRFHQELAKGLTPASALQKTKSWARESKISQHVVQGFVVWGL
jgi:CHAT domain-containing protein